MELPTRLCSLCDWTSYSSAKPGEDVHIDANGLIRDNRGGWRFRANMLGCAVLHIENISTGRQRNPIVSILAAVTCAISFFPSSQDDQWIFGIGFGRHRRPRHFIGGFYGLVRNNLQMPCVAALIDAVLGSIRKIPAATRDLGIDHISA